MVGPGEYERLVGHQVVKKLRIVWVHLILKQILSPFNMDNIWIIVAVFWIVQSRSLNRGNHRSCVKVRLPLERVVEKWCYMFGKVEQGDHSTKQGDHSSTKQGDHSSTKQGKHSSKQGDHQGAMGDHGRPWQHGHNTLCNRSINSQRCGHFRKRQAYLFFNI